jgi:hypothetical protein
MANDDDSLTRRKFIAGAAGAATTVALPLTALAQDQINPPDPDDRQLGAIAKQLARVSAHLTRLDEVSGNPPEPIRVDALLVVRAEAEDIIEIVDDMLRRVG